MASPAHAGRASGTCKWCGKPLPDSALADRRRQYCDARCMEAWGRERKNELWRQKGDLWRRANPNGHAATRVAAAPPPTHDAEPPPPLAPSARTRQHIYLVWWLAEQRLLVQARVLGKIKAGPKRVELRSCGCPKGRYHRRSCQRAGETVNGAGVP